MSDIAIEINNLTKTYRINSNDLNVFKDFSATFHKGSISAIVGPSGCGKTTLLRMIAGLDKPTKGEVFINPKNNRIGMIFQEKALFPWRTVEGNVAFGLELNEIPKQTIQDTVEYWLEKVGLTEFKKYYPTQLSGGMKQRLAFARCMAVDPDIVLMDEPFSSLDSFAKLSLSEFAENLMCETKKTAILVSHDIKEAIFYADSIFQLTNPPIGKYKRYIVDAKRPRGRSFFTDKVLVDIEGQIREI